MALQPDPELITYVADRLQKLKPTKKATVLNAIGAMFQFRGAISDEDKEKMFQQLVKKGRLRSHRPARSSFRHGKRNCGTFETVTESLYSQSSTSLMLAQASCKSSEILRQTMMPRTRWPGSASSLRTQLMYLSS